MGAIVKGVAVAPVARVEQLPKAGRADRSVGANPVAISPPLRLCRISKPLSRAPTPGPPSRPRRSGPAAARRRQIAKRTLRRRPLGASSRTPSAWFRTQPVRPKRRASVKTCGRNPRPGPARVRGPGPACRRVPAPFTRPWLPSQRLYLPDRGHVVQLLVRLRLTEYLKQLVQLTGDRTDGRTREGHAGHGIRQPLPDLAEFRDGPLVQPALDVPVSLAASTKTSITSRSFIGRWERTGASSASVSNLRPPPGAIS